MLATVVGTAFLSVVLARRSHWVRARMPPPASTTAGALAAVVVVLLLAELDTGVGRALLAAGLTIVLAGAAVVALGVLVDVAVTPLRDWWRSLPTIPGPVEWLITRADASRWRVRGWNPAALTIRSLDRAAAVRITGLAAEMSYYALISLVPIATALGSSLGFLRSLVGDAEIEEIRTSIVNALTTVFAEQVAADVLAPLVDGLLAEGSAGFAVGALALTLYLASRVFRAAVRALDDAYRVTERRHVVSQYVLGFVFTIGALVALIALVLLVVVGPLLGDGDGIARTFGLGDAFQVTWDVLRWPAAFTLGFTFLTLLYRYAPNVDNDWRTCLPGAVVGSLGVLLVSTGFTFYVRLAAPSALTADAGTGAVVQAAAQMLSLVLAGVLWIWLASIVVLLGGILNAEMDAERKADDPALG